MWLASTRLKELSPEVPRTQSALRHFRIAPTDLVYLFEDCKRCFYDKYRNGFERPNVFSPHFTNADRAMRIALGNDETIDLGVGPCFKVHSQGLWVESVPIPFEEYGVELSFGGKYDALVRTVDDELFVVDYKTTTQTDGQLMRFRRQLSCYVLSLERPKLVPPEGPFSIDGMALLIFDPTNFVFKSKQKIGGLFGKTRWLELPRSDRRFDEFLRGVAIILGNEYEPQPGACSFCRFRLASRPTVTL